MSEALDRFLAGHATPQAAWDVCDNSEWMLYLLSGAGYDNSAPSENRLLLASLSADFAEHALGQMGISWPEMERLIEAVRLWATDPSEENRQKTLSLARETPRGFFLTPDVVGRGVGSVNRADAAARASFVAWAAYYSVGCWEVERAWQCDRIRALVPLCPLSEEP